MIIKLRQSRLFTIHPDKRFSRKYGVAPGIWNEMWRRYKLLHYTKRDLLDYLAFKSGKRISRASLKRWLWRSEVYSIANPAMQMGVQAVRSDFFGDYEEDVVKELLKNIESSVRKEPKAIP